MGTLSTPELGKKGNTEHPKVNAAIEALNAITGSENKIKGAGIEAETIPMSKFEKGVGAVKWYTPKVIATEESRSNTAFGTLTTADEITGVVVNENALVFLFYSAQFKSSASAAGRAAFFIGANQLKRPGTLAPEVSEIATVLTEFRTCASAAPGLINVGIGGTSFVTTGEACAETSSVNGGPCIVRRLAAGTYTISVQYKATSGTVTAKERLLQVATLG